MRTQDGKVASGIEEEFTCWKNHFGRVLNQECSTTVAKIGEVVDTLNIDTEVPIVEEVKQAIKLFKNGKAPGIDQNGRNYAAVSYQHRSQHSHPKQNGFSDRPISL